MRPLYGSFFKQMGSFLLLFLLAAAIALTTAAEAASLLPAGIGYSLTPQKQSQGLGATFAQMAIAARENEENLILAADSSTLASAQSAAGNPYDKPVKVIFTGGDYQAFHLLRFIKGAMYTNDDPRVGADAAIISKDLAVAMFAGVDVVGAPIYINGTKLTIVGVFELGQSLFERICADGYAQVIVPYTTLLTDKPQYAAHLYVKNAPFDEKKLSPQQRQQARAQQEKAGQPPALDSQRVSSVHLSELDASLGEKLALYEQIDYSERGKIAGQYVRLIWFILGIVLIVFLIRVSVISLSSTGVWALQVHKSVEKLRVGDLARRLILPLALLAAGAGIFYLIRFEIYVPAQIVPPGERILNVSYYIDQYIAAFQQHIGGSADPFYRNVIFYGANIACLFLIVAALFELLLLARAGKIAKRLIAHEEGER